MKTKINHYAQRPSAIVRYFARYDIYYKKMRDISRERDELLVSLNMEYGFANEQEKTNGRFGYDPKYLARYDEIEAKYKKPKDDNFSSYSLWIKNELSIWEQLILFCDCLRPGAEDRLYETALLNQADLKYDFVGFKAQTQIELYRKADYSVG